MQSISNDTELSKVRKKLMYLKILDTVNEIYERFNKIYRALILNSQRPNLYDDYIPSGKNYAASDLQAAKSILSNGTHIGLQRFRCIMAKHLDDKSQMQNIRSTCENTITYKGKEDKEAKLIYLDVKNFCIISGADNFYRLTKTDFLGCVNATSNMRKQLDDIKNNITYLITPLIRDLDIKQNTGKNDIKQNLGNCKCPCKNQQGGTYRPSGILGKLEIDQNMDPELTELLVKYEDTIIAEFYKLPKLTIFMTVLCKSSVYYQMEKNAANAEQWKIVNDGISELDRSGAWLYGSVKAIADSFKEWQMSTTITKMELDTIKGGGKILGFISKTFESIKRCLSISAEEFKRFMTDIGGFFKVIYKGVSCLTFVLLIVAIVVATVVAVSQGVPFAATIGIIMIGALIVPMVNTCMEAYKDVLDVTLKKDDIEADIACFERPGDSNCSTKKMIEIILICGNNAKGNEFDTLLDVLNKICSINPDYDENVTTLIRKLYAPIDSKTKINQEFAGKFLERIKNIKGPDNNNTIDKNKLSIVEQYLYVKDSLNLVLKELGKLRKQYKPFTFAIAVTKFVIIEYKFKSLIAVYNNNSLNKTYMDYMSEIVTPSPGCNMNVIDKINSVYVNYQKYMEITRNGQYDAVIYAINGDKVDEIPVKEEDWHILNEVKWTKNTDGTITMLGDEDMDMGKYLKAHEGRSSNLGGNSRGGNSHNKKNRA